MADLLQTGTTWLAGQLASHAAQTVTYRRGSRSVSVAATKAPVRRVADDQFGILDIHECDWIIRASLLAFSGTPIEPEKGDEIEESSGATWQVLPIEGEQQSRPSDPFHIMHRIHTKRVEA